MYVVSVIVCNFGPLNMLASTFDAVPNVMQICTDQIGTWKSSTFEWRRLVRSGVWLVVEYFSDF